MIHGMVLIHAPRGGPNDGPWFATCLCGWHASQSLFLFDARQEWITHAGVTDALLTKEEK